jgi:succinate dehydrogenase flavin-adding protein (antitoxin of CptAB toxin-antitoxin module)
MEKNLNQNALIWRSRRGMKETEGVLLPFIHTQYEHLSESEKNIYADLLNEPDPDLLNWLVYDETPPTYYEALIHRIQTFTKNHEA